MKCQRKLMSEFLQQYYYSTANSVIRWFPFEPFSNRLLWSKGECKKVGSHQENWHVMAYVFPRTNSVNNKREKGNKRDHTLFLLYNGRLISLFRFFIRPYFVYPPPHRRRPFSPHSDPINLKCNFDFEHFRSDL